MGWLARTLNYNIGHCHPHSSFFQCEIAEAVEAAAMDAAALLRPVAWNNVHRDLQSIRVEVDLIFAFASRAKNLHDNLSVTGNYQVEHKLL